MITTIDTNKVKERILILINSYKVKYKDITASDFRGVLISEICREFRNEKYNSYSTRNTINKDIANLIESCCRFNEYEYEISCSDHYKEGKYAYIYEAFNNKVFNITDTVVTPAKESTTIIFKNDDDRHSEHYMNYLQIINNIKQIQF